jgi:hypothetical protein
MANEQISAELIEAAIQVCGTAFHFKGPLRTVFLNCGVPDQLWQRYESQPKFVLARQVFGDLERNGAAGRAVLRRLLSELANMSGPHPTAENPKAGEEALQRLRRLAQAKQLLVDPEDASRRARRARAQKQQEQVASRRQRLEELHAEFLALHSSVASQERAYALERLLASLFAAHDIDYRKSYRTPREQFDGSFIYNAFTYLVEARWRTSPPDFGDLADFKGKVDGKIESTRGLFLSIAGFDRVVVDHFFGRASGSRNNVVLMDGADLALILEGRVSLPDGLDYKIAKASQEGIVWAPLSEM